MSRETLLIILATVAPGKFPEADKAFRQITDAILREELAKK